MSETKTPLTDKEALATFKRFFDIESKPIETAYQEVDRLTGEIENCHQSTLADQSKADEKQVEVEKLWADFGKQTYSDQLFEATQRDAEALTDEISGLTDRIKATADTVEKLQKDLAAAKSNKRKAPKDAAMTHYRALADRLKAAGFSMKDDVAQSFKDALNDAFKASLDPEVLEVAVKALDARVEELCAPVELGKKQLDIATRLKKLELKPCKNDQVIQNLSGLRDLNHDKIAMLNGEIETQLKEAEEQSNEFEQRISDALRQLQEIGTCKTLDLDSVNHAGMTKTALQLRDEAATGLSEPVFASLADLENHIEAAQKKVAQADQDSAACHRRHDELFRAHAGFRTQSESHKSVTNTDLSKAKGWITEAGNLMGPPKLDFAEAMRRLDLAEEELDRLNEKVLGKIKQQQNQQAKALLKQQEDDAQRLREQANNVAALDAIGRDGKLKQWLTKAGQLINLGLLDVTVGDPWDLNNNGVTVEVNLTLIPTSPNDVLAQGAFVVHYHPHADSTKKNPYGSPMHCKAHKNAPKFNNVDIDSDIAWVSHRVPSLKEIRNKF